VDGTYENFGIHVLDKDVLSKDDYLGVAVISGKDISKKRAIEAELPLKLGTAEDVALTGGEIPKSHSHSLLSFGKKDNKEKGKDKDKEKEKSKEKEKAPEKEKEEKHEDDEENRGTVLVKVSYHPPRFEGKLDITIDSAHGLYNADNKHLAKVIKSKGQSDPYVRVLLDTHEVARTKVIKNNLNPEFHETLHVAVTGEHASFYLAVQDEDVVKDDLIGHLKFLPEDIVKRREISGEDPLLSVPGKNEGRVSGCLKYTIRYSPPSLNGTLHATILKATGLANADTVLVGKSDPFVVVSLDQTELGKTSVIKNNLNPHWNEDLEWDVSGEHQVIRLSVYDEDDGKKPQHLGSVSVGVEQITCDGLVQGTFSLMPNAGDKHVSGTLTFKLQYTPKK